MTPSKKNRLFYFALLSLFFFKFSTAFSMDSVETFLSESRRLNLSSEIAWKRFLYLYKGKSLVITQDFFSSESSASSPQDELEAHIKKLLDPTTREFTFCKFPARSHWLINKLNLPTDLFDKIQCDEFVKFKNLVYPNSVWITFASYYLNSPSSAYGHTLLRLSKSKKEDFNKQNDLLDFAVTFGAVVDTNNAFAYAYKGLTGGFNGNFVALPYYYKIREYNDYESRDLWSYNIELSEEQTTRLLELLWEVDNVYFPYYFFSKNCSYYLLALIEAVDDKINLLDKLPFYVIPIETVKALYSQPNFVQDVQFKPSNRRQFWYSYNSLQEGERNTYRNLIHIEQPSMPLLAYNDETQVHLLDTALAQFDYSYSKELLDSKSFIYQNKHQYLARRSQIPIASPEVQIKPSPGSEPHIGHSPEKWSLGLGLLQQRHDIFDRYAEFGYRFSFHELEDNQEGHFFSQMKLMDLKLRYYSNGAPRLRLHQVSLIDIFSLYPINTYEQKGTWQFEFSFKDFLEPECYHCYGTRLKAAYGYSFEPFQEHKPTLYSLLGARVDTFEYKPKTLRVSPGLGLQFGLWSTIFTSSDSLQGEFSRYYLPTSKNYDRPSFVSTSSIRYSFDFIFSRLHLSYERKDHLNEFEIRFSRYL